MAIIVSASVTHEQKAFMERLNISPSKLLQNAIDEFRDKGKTYEQENSLLNEKLQFFIKRSEKLQEFIERKGLDNEFEVFKNG